MDLPTTRELELETLLRDKEKHIAELGDQVTRLRQYLPSATPSTSDPVTLPPALVSLLLPHINSTHLGTNTAGSGSGTTVAALTQRVRVLQEENDQLYDILKEGETGQLKEEVQSLRRIVQKLESALKESHQTISNLSTELDKSYDAFTAYTAASANTHKHSNSTSSSSNRNSYNSSSANRLPPTGPRAHKKPRLSGSPRRGLHINTNSNGNTGSNMDIDLPDPRRSRSPLNPRKGGGGSGGGGGGGGRRTRDREREERERGDRGRERDRDRERDRSDRSRDSERHRDREREREGSRDERGHRPGKDKDRSRPKRDKRPVGNGNPMSSNGGGVNSAALDRTLAERMGIGS